MSRTFLTRANAARRKFNRILFDVQKFLAPADAANLVERYKGLHFAEISYATVRDYCDSAGHLPWLSSIHHDLKDVQRPWVVKAILSHLPIGARILEIGGGEPLVSGILAELGYQVVLVDPYDGSGNGPTEYERFKREYPHVYLIRGLFARNALHFKEHAFDAIFSVSVLEHVHEPHLGNLFDGIRQYLRPGGYSIHAVDHVLEGNGDKFHEAQLVRILEYQAQCADKDSRAAAPEFSALLSAAREDLETYYLSAEGHNLWRGQMPYDEFPFRKCISIQLVNQKVLP